MNNKEITTAMTVPGTVRTAVVRDIWSKIQCEETGKQGWLFERLSGVLPIYSSSMRGRGGYLRDLKNEMCVILPTTHPVQM